MLHSVLAINVWTLRVRSHPWCLSIYQQVKKGAHAWCRTILSSLSVYTTTSKVSREL